MKAKIFFFGALILFVCPLLCSCAQNHREQVHFLHAAAIMQDEKSDLLSILAVVEKQGAKDSDSEYFIASSQGETIDKAAKALDKKYGGCYFASCELFVVPDDADEDFARKCAQICQSPLMPSHPYTLCAKQHEIEGCLKLLKDEEDIIKLISKVTKHAPVFVRFVSDRLSGKATVLPVISQGRDGKINLSQYAVFHGSSTVSYRKEKTL